MSLYRDQLESWLKTISISCNCVIDIGGSAFPVEKRLNNFNVKEYIIVDNENEKDYHEKWDTPNFIFDIQEKTLPRLEGIADVVFMLEVSEYLYNPLEALKNIKRLLKKGGLLYCSWASIYPFHQPIKKDCLRYTLSGIETLLDKAGFSLEKVVSRVATKGLKSLADFYSLEAMRGAKRNPCLYDIGYMTICKND